MLLIFNPNIYSTFNKFFFCRHSPAIVIVIIPSGQIQPISILIGQWKPKKKSTKFSKLKYIISQIESESESESESEFESKSEFES